MFLTSDVFEGLVGKNWTRFVMVQTDRQRAD